MRGWFDAFRTDGGPTLYSSTNRTAASEDLSSVIVYLVFGTLFLAFLLIFPGIRKEKLNTFISVTLSLYVGLVVLLSIYGSDWHVADTTASAPYKAFSKEKITADLGVRIGLSSVNITLRASLRVNQTSAINYNERFFWRTASEIRDGYREALFKGLPFPILTVVEYLSLNSENFSWGGRYRLAGYYSCILLWASFTIWCLMNVLFCVVPRYGAYSLILTGLLLLLTNVVYYTNLPSTPLVIPFENGTLRFSFGWCYWLVLVTGFICVIVGAVIAVIDVIFPHKFSTILEVDYDTPYDRHIILQDKTKTSHVHHNQNYKNSALAANGLTMAGYKKKAVLSPIEADQLPSQTTIVQNEPDPFSVKNLERQLGGSDGVMNNGSGTAASDTRHRQVTVAGADNLAFDNDEQQRFPWRQQLSRENGVNHPILKSALSSGHSNTPSRPTLHRYHTEVTFTLPPEGRTPLS